MFWMRAYPLRGQLGGVGPWISRVFGPVKWHRADRGVPFEAQKLELLSEGMGEESTIVLLGLEIS